MKASLHCAPWRWCRRCRWSACAPCPARMRAERRASVSAVSLLWLMVTTSVFGWGHARGSGTRWRSRPRGDLGDRPSQYLAVRRRCRSWCRRPGSAPCRSARTPAAAPSPNRSGVIARMPRSSVSAMARLLEDLLLHVVAVRAQFGRAAVGVDRLDRTLDAHARRPAAGGDPVLVPVAGRPRRPFQVDDLVGHAGQRQRRRRGRSRPGRRPAPAANPRGRRRRAAARPGRRPRSRRRPSGAAARPRLTWRTGRRRTASRPGAR